MAEKIPRPGEQHPPEWREDLNPDANAGLNYNLEEPQPEVDGPVASELPGARDRIQDLSKDELEQLPVLPEGSRLEQGATYVDLRDPDRREFTATAGMVAGPDHWYVPKNKVGYQLWNRVIGVTNPERLGEADER